MGIDRAKHVQVRKTRDPKLRKMKIERAIKAPEKLKYDLVLLKIPLKFAPMYIKKVPSTKSELRNFIHDFVKEAKDVVSNRGYICIFVDIDEVPDNAPGLAYQFLYSALERYNLELINEIILPIIPNKHLDKNIIKDAFFVSGYKKIFVIQKDIRQLDAVDITSHTLGSRDNKRLPDVMDKRPQFQFTDSTESKLTMGMDIWFIKDLMLNPFNITKIWNILITKMAGRDWSVLIMYSPETCVDELDFDCTILDKDDYIYLYYINDTLNEKLKYNVAYVPVRMLTVPLPEFQHVSFLSKQRNRMDTSETYIVKPGEYNILSEICEDSKKGGENAD